MLQGPRDAEGAAPPGGSNAGANGRSSAARDARAAPGPGPPARPETPHKEAATVPTTAPREMR